MAAGAARMFAAEYRNQCALFALSETTANQNIVPRCQSDVNPLDELSAILLCRWLDQCHMCGNTPSADVGEQFAHSQIVRVLAVGDTSCAAGSMPVQCALTS